MQLSDKVIVSALPVMSGSLPTVGVYQFTIPLLSVVLGFNFLNPGVYYSISEVEEVAAVQTLLNTAFPGSTVQYAPGGTSSIVIIVPIPPGLPTTLVYSASGTPPFTTLQGVFLRVAPAGGAIMKYYVESIYPFIPVCFRITIGWAKTPTEGTAPVITYGFHNGGNVADVIQACTFRDYDMNGAFSECGANGGSPFYHPVVPISDFRYFSAEMRLREGLHYLAVTSEFALYHGLGPLAGGIGAECIVVQFIP